MLGRITARREYALVLVLLFFIPGCGAFFDDAKVSTQVFYLLPIAMFRRSRVVN